MKDFFERQESARKKTFLLIVLFAIAVILIVISVYAVITALSYWLSTDNFSRRVPFTLWNQQLFVYTCVITLFVVAGGTLYKVRNLRGGGYRVARMLGGRRVSRTTRDPEEIRLLNVVEEMAIASGVPAPDVYVMDRESGINAFAAGFGIDDAVVCVTKGAMSLLKRDELQGVVAHEFSHIFNGDMRINIHLMGWLHGILLISFAGEGLLRAMRYARRRGSAAIAALGLALYLLGYIGVFFGTLIKSAISRQRESLADAAAVQYTRNPSGLAGALKKVGGLTFGGRLTHPKVSEASHMYFCDGVGNQLLQTHPPLHDRILSLDPHFDGVYPKVKVAPTVEKPTIRPRRPAMPKGQIPPVVTGATAMAILETIGAPMHEHAEMAREMLEELPEPVRIATREPSGARALIYILLLDRDKAVRSNQIALLKEHVSPEVVAEAETIAGYLSTLSPRLRLPLVDLALPTLRHLSAEEYAAFKVNVNRLITADNKLSLFELVLNRILVRHLAAHFFTAKKKLTQIYGVRGVEQECSLVLSLLARTGQPYEEDAAEAFEQGAKILEDPRASFQFLPADECTLQGLDRALEKLDAVSPLIKRKLMAACLQCLTYDKTIAVEEAELFRAVGEALGIPVPPWLMFREG